MRSKIMAGVFLAVFATVIPTANTEGQDAVPGDTAVATPPAPTVVKRERVYPKKTIRKRSRFTPWSKPTQAQVYKIIAIEASRWGAPAWRLACRIRGESQFRWWIVNSSDHGGLGQFASSTFYRGMSSIGTRVVKMTDRRTTTRPTYIVRTWSDGHTTKEQSKRVRVKVLHTYVGKIPRTPPRLHGWAQVRIMARAMVGKGNVNDGEWSVRC